MFLASPALEQTSLNIVVSILNVMVTESEIRTWILAVSEIVALCWALISCVEGFVKRGVKCTC